MLIRVMQRIRVLVPFLLAATLWGGNGVQIALADNPPSTATTQEAQPVPMSDAALNGAGCLALATPVMAAAYAVGPTEIMMLVSGAVIVPSSSPQLLIVLGGILGGAACGVGSALTPVISWLVESLKTADTASQTATANNIEKAQVIAVADKTDVTTASTAPEAQAPMDESFVQSTGCLAGVMALGAITLASAPIEIVGLAAGGVGVPTNTAILLLALTGTVVPAGCTVGSAAALPIVALSHNFGLDTIGQSLTSMFNWGESKRPIVNTSPYVRMEQPKSAINASIKPVSANMGGNSSHGI